MAKVHAPKDGAPGSVIVWTQYSAHGSTVERIGEVWSLAPIENGMTSPVWVVSEDGAVLCVARGRKGGTIVKGSPFAGEYSARVPEGAWYSETHAMTPTGAATERATRHAYAVRQSHAVGVAA